MAGDQNCTVGGCDEAEGGDCCDAGAVAARALDGGLQSASQSCMDSLVCVCCVCLFVSLCVLCCLCCVFGVRVAFCFGLSAHDTLT
jgi:hypothetical protein